MYFTEKFVAPIIKRFGGDPERGEFGLFGGVQGKGELDVFKAQMIVSDMNSGGWKGAPSLYYECGGEIKIVQGNYRLLGWVRRVIRRLRLFSSLAAERGRILFLRVWLTGG